MAEYRVVEKFISINGEGRKAGQLTSFIRLQICNLECSYCDTKWANTEDSEFEIMTEEELAEWAVSTGIVNVTVTGGEPLLHRDMDKLFKALIEAGREVEVETNGSVSISEFGGKYREKLSFTLDYKLPSSGMENSMLTENYDFLRPQDTVKFVAGSRKDLERAEEIIEKYGLKEKCSVYLSPVFGNIEPEDMVEFMIERKMNGVNLQLQMHKFIWDPEMRGV